MELSNPIDGITDNELLMGYALRNNLTYFLFDTRLYKVQPQSIILTGTFRNWWIEEEREKWELQPMDTDKLVWMLVCDNIDTHIVPGYTEFKFKVEYIEEETGEKISEWRHPLHAPNYQNGNLTIISENLPLVFKAELKRPRSIWATVDGFERPLSPEFYTLYDSSGQEYEIQAVLPNTEENFLVVPAKNLDLKRAYFLSIPSRSLITHCAYDGWFRELYSDKELGANVIDDGNFTVFRLFAPRATSVRLYLYEEPESTDYYEVIELAEDQNGVWETVVEGNLHGIYYDYTVHGAVEKGNYFYESNPIHISDPYARVVVDTWGKCRVWERTKPATPLKNGIPKHEDIIAYEVHIQDFTDLLPVEKSEKGTIPAMTKPKLRNKEGFKIGFDYLIDLGINVLHLMPVQEYLHYPTKKWKELFENDPMMQKLGIAEENYQWGYRTTHAFAVETRYRQKNTEYGAQREQFRDLVQAFHDKNIAVIIDIVPNHSGENMDEAYHFFHFNAIDKLYYYRTKNFKHLGGYGNEIKTEERPMVQRWLIDQCKHFIEEFGVDGFRIDLAGQVDKQTLKALRQALGEDIIIYGEPWIDSTDPDFEANPSWDWYKHDAPIMFFQDAARNAYKGHTGTPRNKKFDRGFAGGNPDQREEVKQALANKFWEDKTPLSGISYLDIHDNWALADRFAKFNRDGRYGVEEERIKIAAVLLYTTLGPIVTHGGTEILRSKGLGDMEGIIKELPFLEKAQIHIHGKRDTYNLRTPNQFIWENVGKTIEQKDIWCNYRGMYLFWQGLNKFRLSKYGKVFRQAESVSDDYYQFIEPENRHLLGYLVDKKILVLINVDDHDAWFHQVCFPEGKWRLIGNQNEFDYEFGVTDLEQYVRIEGGKHYDLGVATGSFKVWMKTDI